MIRNYYQILGLKPEATKDQIKQAYHIYATKFHPDKQKSDKFFEERFKEIKEAYDILIDDRKRAEYDAKFSSYSNVSQSKNTWDYPDGIIGQWDRERKEFERKEKIKRKRVYYTSKDLILNGLYVNCNGKSYYLAEYDSSTIRKDDGTSFVTLGIVLIIIGIITIAFYIGIFFLAFGLFSLFFREYYIVLIGKTGDEALIKGRKSKMRKISNMINLAMTEIKQ